MKNIEKITQQELEKEVFKIVRHMLPPDIRDIPSVAERLKVNIHNRIDWLFLESRED